MTASSATNLNQRFAIRVVLFALLLTPLARSQRAEAQVAALDTSPGQSVYVRIERAMLYSGPSEDYYPTDRVPPAAELKVAERTDGWLGVEPVPSSFSWVPARQAYLLPGGKEIEITTNNSVSWIGSSLGRAKQFRWQVKLDKGTQLRVLGEATVKNEEGKPVLWYRVTPPPGELRWIKSDIVSTQPVVVISRGETNASSNTDVRTASASRPTGSATADGAVVSAQHNSVVEELPMQDDVFRGGSAEEIRGEPIMLDGNADGNIDGVVEGGVYYEGELPYGGQGIDGQVYDGQIVDGHVIHHDGGMVHEGEILSAGPVAAPDPKRHFEGWHAMEFSDDGLFFPWMAKLFASAPAHDPLAHDPFSLAPMPKRTRGMTMPPPQQTVDAQPQPRSHLHSVPGVYVPRDRPWRDPRTLRQSRPSAGSLPPPRQDSPNYDGPTAAPDPTSGAAGESDSGAFFGNQGSGPLAAAQDRINSVRAALRDSLRRYQSSGELTAPEERDFTSGIERAIEQLSPTGGVGENTLDGRSPYGGQPGNSKPGGRLDNDPSSVNWYGVSGGERDADGDSAMNRPATNTTFASSRQRSTAGPLSRGQLPTVEQLLIELSDTVARPVQQWDLASVATQAQRIVDGGANAIERGQARLLLERIEQFDRVARQSGASAPRSNPFSLASRTTSPSVGLASASRAQSQVPTARSAELQAKYDATGWLVLVHGSSPDKPPYALTDSAGQILAYVSALPGLKFDAYLNKPVGVNGRRGYLPQMQAAHVQAERMHELR